MAAGKEKDALPSSFEYYMGSVPVIGRAGKAFDQDVRGESVAAKERFELPFTAVRNLRWTPASLCVQSGRAPAFDL